MRTFAALCIAVLVMLFLTTCKKEYSYEGGPAITNDSAIYSLEGFPYACSNTKTLGNYIIGTKLNSTNTITLMVDVSKIGIYNLSTTVLNGMSFSSGGRFTKTGIQEIVLQATGTPASKGVYTFPVIAGNSSCNFVINVTEPATQVMTLNTWEFTQDKKTFRGYFDGALTTLVNGSLIVTLVGLTPTKDTAISILLDIPGSVVKTGNYSSKVNASFVFFDNLGNNIFLSDKIHPTVELIVVVSSYDVATQIVAGTFTGTSLTRSNDIVSITEGKFRAKLNQ